MIRKVIFVIIFALICISAYAVDCPQDGMSMYFTGQTKSEWGKLLQLHKCPIGHQYWVTYEQSRSYNPPSYSIPSYNYGSIKCPLDGMMMYFTGRMKGLTKVYRCPSGHEADVR